jgi:hypothetical protein
LEEKRNFEASTPNDVCTSKGKSTLIEHTINLVEDDDDAEPVAEQKNKYTNEKGTPVSAIVPSILNQVEQKKEEVGNDEEAGEDQNEEEEEEEYEDGEEEFELEDEDEDEEEEQQQESNNPEIRYEERQENQLALSEIFRNRRGRMPQIAPIYILHGKFSFIYPQYFCILLFS